MPLRKAAALDYHRMGSKIYCLGSDGSKGEYASKEMIQAHEGLFGMESQMWERIRDQDLDYADEDFGAFQEPMNVIETGRSSEIIRCRSRYLSDYQFFITNLCYRANGD